MNFFERQDAAKGTTLKLVFLFASAVIALVAVIDGVVALAMASKQSDSSAIVATLVVVTAVTLLIIAGGMISKTASLRQGGSAVATSVGAVPVDPTTTDPALRRFVNIVEEMSLASGVPMPRLFVMTHEPAINAFAAGYTPADAAVTVTQGALDNLNRDELQGVIGHEFSHILNGDMRLNIRLIGLLNGILLIGLIGLRVLQFGGRGSDRKNAPPILLIALAMLVLGFIGVFFANIIKAAVSRQREWLADASAVQFTRQTTGLEGAFKKIAGLRDGTVLRDSRSAAEVSHMLFGEGRRSFSGLWDTHPPLFDRIHALDPSFTREQFAELTRASGAGLGQGAELLGEQAAAAFAQSIPPAPSRPGITVQPSEVTRRVGTLTPADLAHGAGLSAQIPPRFRQLATQGTTTVPLLLAMLVSSEDAVRDRQLAIIAARMPQDAHTAAIVATQLAQLPEVLRLPVVSIALPVLGARPRDQLRALLETLNELALADGSVSLYEYCLTRVVWSYLQDAADPYRRSRVGSATLGQVQPQQAALLSTLAAAGGARAPAAGWPQLDAGWAALDALAPREKERLVEQMVTTVLADGRLEVAEAELLRAACAVIHVPLPPLVA
jgi:Zn-dependent protease with chaperone function